MQEFAEPCIHQKRDEQADTRCEVHQTLASSSNKLTQDMRLHQSPLLLQKEREWQMQTTQDMMFIKLQLLQKENRKMQAGKRLEKTNVCFFSRESE